jgi:hypothetical protein
MQQKTKTPIFVAWSIFAWLGVRFNATFNNISVISSTYIVAVSFIGGGNRSAWRKPPTGCKSLTNFIT